MRPKQSESPTKGTTVKGSPMVQDHVLLKARESLNKGEPWMAKSWFLTGSALFPTAFSFQYGRYLMAKAEGNVEEAKEFLCEMLMNPNATKLEEVKVEQRSIVDVIKSEECPNSDEQSFYRHLFDELLPAHQFTILESVSKELEVGPNWSDLCRLKLLTLKRFPEKLRVESSTLVDIVMRSEVADPNQADLYRKMLIFEVLPLILSTPARLDADSVSQLEGLVLKAFQFYVNHSYLSPIKSKDGGATTGLVIDEVENKISEVVTLAARKFNWQEELFVNSSSDMVLVQLHNQVERLDIAERRSSGDDGPIDLSASNSRNQSPNNLEEKDVKQIVFSTALLFLKCLNKYCRAVDGKLILVEKYITGLSNTTGLTPTGKKKRKLMPTPILTAELITPDDKLKSSFLSALKCLQIVENCSAFQKEFRKLLQVINLEQSKAYQMLIIDSYLYQGRYAELIKEIAVGQQSQPDLRTSLQVMSASMMLYDYTTALQYAFFAIELIKDASNWPASQGDSHGHATPEVRTRAKSCSESPGVANSRQLFFVDTTPQEILSSCIETMIACLKSTVLLSLKPSDMGLGHLVVLSQYQWPSNVELLLQVVNVISAQIGHGHTSRNSMATHVHKFVYPFFVDYVFNPDILEEFMALASDERLHMELNQRTESGMIATKSMTTRGVNKGAKEEVRTTLINQMRSSRAFLDNSLLIQFILEKMRPTLAAYF